MGYPLTYKTLAAPSEGYYREKGSRFLAFAMPARSEEEISHRITQLRKKYHDARHVCYAWVLGADGKKWRAADDGEPRHTAGEPILGQIQSRQLTFVLVVVVRYFGGIKLGTGGLAAAYRQAAADALSRATVVTCDVLAKYSLTCSYDALSQLMKALSRFHVQILGQDYEGSLARIEVSVPLRNKESFLNHLHRFKSAEVFCQPVAEN
jgi:uncharacterized YigZ family protein